MCSAIGCPVAERPASTGREIGYLAIVPNLAVTGCGSIVEAPRVHHAARRDGGIAARGGCSATGDASGRPRQRPVARGLGAHCRALP